MYDTDVDSNYRLEQGSNEASFDFHFAILPSEPFDLLEPHSGSTSGNPKIVVLISFFRIDRLEISFS